MSEVLSLLGERGHAFLTNRFNLLQLLSCGFVPTREGFDKYYDDLLAMAPGRVVVFPDRVSASVAAMVEATPQAFPVLVAVAWDPSFGSAPSYTPASADGPVAWAPTGPLALPDKVVVHFRSEEERSEHQARRFANVPADVELSVSPDLFSGGEMDAPALSSWLAALEPVESRSGESEKSLDRVLGGVCLLAEARRRSGGTEAALALVEAVTSRGSEWPVTVALRSDGAQPAMVDSLVFRAAAALMQASPPGQLPPPQLLLEEIRRRVAEQGLPDDVAATLEQNLNRAEVVLRGEEDMRPLRAGQGLPAVKAVLLTMLRRDPERLFGQAGRDAGDDPASVEAAAFLIGVGFGRTLLPLEYRPPVLDLPLVEHTVRALTQSPDVSSERRSNRERILSLDASDAAQRSQLARACEVMQWDDLVTSVLVGTSARVEPGRVGRSSGVHVRMPGVVAVDYEVDVAGLRQRVQGEPARRFERADVGRCLTDEADPAKPRRRRAARKSPEPD